MSDEAVEVRKGKLWISVGALVAVIALVWAEVANRLDQAAKTNEIIKTLEERKQRDIAVEGKIDQVVVDQRAMRLDLNEALRDPWTYTDTLFWGEQQLRFWSDFARMNPTLTMPTWPAPKRIRPDDPEGKR